MRFCAPSSRLCGETSVGGSPVSVQNCGSQVDRQSSFGDGTLGRRITFQISPKELNVFRNVNLYETSVPLTIKTINPCSLLER